MVQITGTLFRIQSVDLQLAEAQKITALSKLESASVSGIKVAKLKSIPG
jgi:hypothetical protein